MVFPFRRPLRGFPSVLVLLCTLPVLGLSACSGGPPGEAPAASPTTRDQATPAGEATPAGATAAMALYADDQAERGRRVFQDHCSECHYSSEMRGTQFQWVWERQTVGDLLEHLVRTMPEDDPGSLSEPEYLEVVAYILRLNGFEAGARPLAGEGPALTRMLKAPESSR